MVGALEQRERAKEMEDRRGMKEWGINLKKFELKRELTLIIHWKIQE